MKRNLFYNKNKKQFIFSITFLLLIIIIFYFISFYIIINKNNFIIFNSSKNIYYIIPEDKEGEKVKFTNKKSLNNFTTSKEYEINHNVNDLKYSIQLFSDINHESINNYKKKLLDLKSQIISSDDLYIFSINTQIGADFFLSYKNFDTYEEANNYCEKLSFVKKCLIINLTN